MTELDEERSPREAMTYQLCPGCGVTVPAVPGPVHAYVPASAGCWSHFCSLTDWMQSLAGSDGITVAQRAVDSYMVQHAANPERRNRQSVAVHLMSLCASLEHQVPGHELRNLLGNWTHRDYPELLPRPLHFEITVEHVISAQETKRLIAVGAWARSAWEAWILHHETVRGWLADGEQPAIRVFAGPSHSVPAQPDSRAECG